MKPTIKRRTIQRIIRQVSVFSVILLICLAVIVFSKNNAHSVTDPTLSTIVTTTSPSTIPTTTTTIPPTTTTTTQPVATLQSKLQATVNDIIAKRSGTVSVAVFDAKTGESWASSSQKFDTASIVKVSILEALLQSHQNKGTPLSASELATAKQMISISDNDSATTLWNEMGGTKGMTNVLPTLGATATVAGTGGSWGLTQTTAADQVALMRLIAYANSTLSNASRQTATSLLNDVVSSQKWGVSAGVADASVQLKNGWLPRTAGWDINSIGHISGNGHDYVIAVLSKSDPSEAYGIETTEEISKAVWTALA